LGYVSESQRVPEWMRVGEFLSYCRAYYPNWCDLDAAELAARLQLPLEQRLRALSRGVRAKVALASVLSYRPRLVLLDEPFGSLDVLVREQVAESILDRVPETTVVLATHDLLDIESFATHIAYIDLGRLVFVEELGSLLARFREVELTFDEAVPPPTALPDEWIKLEDSGRVLRFVDTRYHVEASAGRIRSTFAGIRNAEVRPMALRAIFVALAGSQSRTNA
jgi:ABC-2 type transport system ATP-binding protein